MNLRKNITKMLLLLIIGLFSIGTFNSKPAVAANSAEPYIGQILLFAFNYAPIGWVECKGQIVNKAQNTALFSLLGSKFGGDGVSTFGLPNLENASPIPGAKYYIAMNGYYPSKDSGIYGSIGTIALFPYNFTPGDWAYCDGTIMNVNSNNTALFSLLGANYGGDGSNTFAIPNLQNASPIKNDIKYYICVNGIYPDKDRGGDASVEYMGSIDLFAFKFNPGASYVSECTGQTFNVSQNNALFSLLGTTYGGNGTSTCGIPDLRGAGPSPKMGYYIWNYGIYPSRS
jgi:microcystin-dependent protein